MMKILTAVIGDTRHVLVKLEAVHAPDIHNGGAFAAATHEAFDKIEESDVAWRSELHTGVWTWPTASRVKRERVRTSIEALIQVGRQFEALPHNLETQNAMARSPVCRQVFGSVRASGKEIK